MIREFLKNRKRLKLILIAAGSLALVIIVTAAVTVLRTVGRTQIQFEIRQNKEIIHLSTFAEPPQFAIWLENAKTHKLKTVFVTSRVSKGDWEGKPNVPVALPRWFGLFRGENKSFAIAEDDEFSAVTGATPKDDYFRVRIEVEPGSEWLCWIEMNLAGDYNESFPEFDLESLKEDEFSCGQPALLYKADVTASEGLEFTPVLDSQSVWQNGINRLEPVSPGITTARDVFEEIRISVIRPKPKLVEKYKIANNDK